MIDNWTNLRRVSGTVHTIELEVIPMFEAAGIIATLFRRRLPCRLLIDVSH